MDINDFLNRKLTKTGEMPNGDNIYLITEKSVNAIKEQLRIGGVGVTLPNIDEINKALKKEIEDLEYREKLDGYEIVSYKRGFTFCLKWLRNKLTKGN